VMNAFGARVDMADNEFDELNERMLEELLKINPDTATGFGIHEPYDWQLPHGGFKRYEETRTLLASWYAKAEEIAASQALNNEQRLSVGVLKMLLDVTEFSLKDYPHWKMNPDALETPGGLLFMMLTREYAPYDQRASAMCSRINRLPKYLAEFRERFRDSKPVLDWTKTAITSCEQFPGFLRFIEGFSRGKIPEDLMQDLSKAIRSAEEALKDHIEWLEKQEESATRKFAMGKRKFAEMMRLRGLGLTPKEILALGEKYLSDFKEQRAKVAERIAPGKGVQGARESIKSKAPQTFEEALKATEEEMNRAKKFIIEHNIATVDPEARLTVLETPSFLAPLIPFAALNMPSKFDKRQEGLYVVTRPKEASDLSDHLNYASIINTAVHEAYPGHFHQGVASNKKHWMLEMAASGGGDIVATATETVEGWAHYCEKMMFDHGYEATDEAEFEMLNGAIWRACRIVADVKLAQGDSTIEEMTDWITRETGMARNAMEDEVKRYSHTPGQALSYMVGRHLILDLRRSLEATLGPRFDEKRFHDVVAGYGYLPFSLLKEAVALEFGLQAPP
jgi:uncharacterized protein (DUF885 family)